MQWYSSMQIPPFDRVLVKIASYFLNFPPKTLHAIVVLNANPSLSKSSCHDCKSFSKLPPKPYMQWYSLMHILPFHRVLVTMASHFLNFPPKAYMQWYSLMHILPFHRVLVTMASHFLNFPPKTLHAISVLNANRCLSKSSCHDCKSFLKLPTPRPSMQ